MSEVDRLSNSGLYPALPVGDKRSSKDGTGEAPRGGKQPHDKSTPQSGTHPDSAIPRPPKSLIDEYA
jgi:hypothetical protein